MSSSYTLCDTCPSLRQTQADLLVLLISSLEKVKSRRKLQSQLTGTALFRGKSRARSRPRCGPGRSLLLVHEARVCGALMGEVAPQTVDVRRQWLLAKRAADVLRVLAERRTVAEGLRAVALGEEVLVKAGSLDHLARRVGGRRCWAVGGRKH